MEYIPYIIVLVFLEGEVTGKPSPSLKNDDMKKEKTMICILFTRIGYSCLP